MLKEKQHIKVITWDLSDLYNDINDPKINSDIQKAIKLSKAITKQYKSKVYKLKPNDIKHAIENIEYIISLLTKILAFSYLKLVTNISDYEYNTFAQKIQEIVNQIAKEIIFFELEWIELPEPHIEKILQDPILSNYRFYLKNIRKYKKHLLSHEQEQLLIEISPVGKSSWLKLFDKILEKQKYGSDQLTLEEIISKLYADDRDVRKKAAKALTEGLKQNIEILCHIFNTVIADKMINDKIRKYDNWITATNLQNNIDDNTVDILIATVNQNFSLVKEYYLIKKELLGLKELLDYDRYAPPPFTVNKTISWEQTKDIILDSFYEFSPIFGDIAKDFFEKNWIDATIREDKVSGAFSHPTIPSLHPYILINFTGNLRDVETLAHELGHGIHQILSSKYGLFNSQPPIILAETASIFTEFLVFNKLITSVKDPIERLALYLKRIESIISTVFRQIAMFNFENLIHTHRRTKAELSVEDFSQYWLKTQNEMFQGSVTLTQDYGVWWAHISHFLQTPGYVYSYAFGQLLVYSLYERYLEDKAVFRHHYIELLSKSGCEYPYELLKQYGIDINTKQFWQKGINQIANMLTELKTLSKEVI